MIELYVCGMLFIVAVAAIDLALIYRDLKFMKRRKYDQEDK